MSDSSENHDRASDALERSRESLGRLTSAIEHWCDVATCSDVDILETAGNELAVAAGEYARASEDARTKVGDALGDSVDRLYQQLLGLNASRRS